MGAGYRAVGMRTQATKKKEAAAAGDDMVEDEKDANEH